MSEDTTSSQGAPEDGASRTVHLRTCPLCEAMCGLEVHVGTDAGTGEQRVELIRADRDDVWSKGYLCPKGTTLGHLHHDPDRLRAPVVREGDEWREVTWDEAFRRCSELLAPVIAEHGIGAVTAYVGNPLAHALSLSRYIGILIGMSGIPMIYSPGTVDQWPKNVSSHLMYGGMWRIPVPDIRRTDLIVMMGANPHASQGSLMACPDVMGELAAIRDRGGRVVVVDPRRTGTAERADEWLPIVPGTDAALLMAVVQVLFAEDLVAPGAAGEWIDGLDDVRALAADWTPERVTAVTGVPAERIRQLARELAGTERAVLYGRIGTCNQEFGTLASWLVDVVNILTGHLDTVGGAMFPRASAWPVTDLPMPELEHGVPNFGRWRSRVRGAPEVLGHVPVSCLAEEISTPGEGQIRALFTVAGNPVLSAPEGDHLDAALGGLDCMISVDNWINETTRHAHVILPGLSPLEQAHHDDLIWNFAVGSGAKFSEAIFPPADGRPEEWEILIRLAGACLGQPAEEVDVTAIDDGFFDVMASVHGLDGAEIRAGYERDGLPNAGPERLVDLTLRTGPFGDRYGEVPDGITLEKVRAEPHGIDLGPMVPQLPEVLRTEPRRIVLAPPYITDDLPRLAARLERPEGGLVLVSRRDLRSNNSWMHNVEVLVKGRPRCTLHVHPDDAARLGLLDGEPAQVSSETGSIEVPVEVTDAVMPGVVSLPHGWGHDRPGTRNAVARAHAGVNSNVLSPGTFVDVPSGNAAVNGIPVEVVAARVPEPVAGD
ncbi:molybdopterin oxidoreductase family protein [Dermatobacter hominis]|uniref:molybdopterin oxidoreductase family protein n=1 Tax=Dermatobacter hominis TaxID=2884263 RepID=UPI001D1221D6|nr:molybdopterin oxidoreductase family protein [Dermatobacter hominis]UDY36504.1 molybdopterin oxidoreductase family protein [Dermatobacter hominis]